MQGVKKLMTEMYFDAATVINNEFLPQWIYSRAIHPDDRHLPGNNLEKYFFNGARVIATTIDQEEMILTADECIDRLMEHISCELLTKLCQGVCTVAEYDEVCQIAMFGKIRYPGGELVDHHDARSAAGVAHTGH